MTPEIRNWLNSQHLWIQEAAFRALTNGSIATTDIADLSSIIESPPQGAQLPKTYPSIGAGSSTQIIKLDSIGDITGIDKLNPKTPLRFGPTNLIVVYGNNGTGKSGYVRIIKKFTGKAGATNLKPDVYKTAPAISKCKVSYTVGTTAQSADWIANASPISDLTSIDVFDSRSGTIYLEAENEATYTPPELLLFTGLVDVAQKLEAALRAKSGALVSALPALPPAFVDTPAATVYGSLRHTTQPAQLAVLYPWTEADQKLHQQLSESLKAADPAADARKLRATKRHVDALAQSLRTALTAVSDEAIKQLNTIYNDSIEKRKIAQESAKALASSAVLEGIGSSTWRSLWSAAKDYSLKQAFPEKIFPHVSDGARCVLCHQELDAEAQKRLTDFEGYVTGKLETAARQSDKAWKEALEAMPKIQQAEALNAACLAAGLEEIAITEVTTLCAKIGSRISAINAIAFDKIPAAITREEAATIERIEKFGISLSEKADRLDESAKKSDRAAASKAFNNLEAKKWTAQQQKAIEAELERLKKIQFYDTCIRQTSTTGISRQAGELSEKLITEAYINRFNTELAKLGANRISVELKKTRTAKGKVKHEIKLKGLVGAGAPVDILSEGENRVVTLAAFLADVTGKVAPSSFVFDDPISSLDSNFEEKVSARLVELSLSRQVIVFTHRLSLYSHLLEAGGSAVSDVWIGSTSVGNGDPMGMPLIVKKPKDALSKLKTNRLPQAAKIFKDHGQEAYYVFAKGICSEIRILIEYIVEKTLLDEIVLRHRRSVMTNNKIHKLALINKKDCDVIEDFMTRYSCFEHSQSEETPVVVPELAALTKDLDELITWHDECRARLGSA